MGKQWTHEMFVNKVFELVGDEFRVVGEYRKNNIKISMYHKKCDRYFEILPADFKRRKRCPLCHGKFKKSTQQFKSQVASLSNGDYEVLGKYINADTHIEMKHMTCGYTWNIAPDKFLSGRRCPRCARNIRKTTIQFKKEVFELSGNEYSVLGKYEKAHTKILLRHNSEVCGVNEFKMTPTDFLGGKRCPKCKVLKQSGEAHWNYNPALTEEDRQKRDLYNGEIRKWRDRVYKRDNYTCVICEVHSHDLNAHHLNSWDVYKDQRFDVRNGVTLCKDCHLLFHSKYGFGNNTKEQFIEFNNKYTKQASLI